MNIALNATTRKETGHRVKNVRASGKVPAVVYGQGEAATPVTLGASEFLKVYRAAGTSSLIDLQIDESAPAKVLVQEVQLNPLTMRPQHVDLKRIRMDQELEVEVPLVFEGEAPAVKELAGTLVQPFEKLTVKCLPKDLPPQLAVNLSKLKTFDDTITVADIALPAGVTILDDAGTTVATVTPPLTDEQLKKMEEASQVDVTAIKTEAEEKKAAEEAQAAEEGAAAEAAKS